MNIKKTAKDTAVTAAISFIISAVTTLFSGSSNDQKVEQEIKNNKVVNIVNEESQVTPSGSAWPFVIIAILMLVICVMAFMLCRRRQPVRAARDLVLEEVKV